MLLVEVQYFCDFLKIFFWQYLAVEYPNKLFSEILTIQNPNSIWLVHFISIIDMQKKILSAYVQNVPVGRGKTFIFKHIPTREAQIRYYVTAP